MIPHDQIDSDAQKVVRRLARSGFSAYLVGGCVRDLLLGRKPKDFDVATSATPPELKSLFRNCRIIGRRFRLAHIFFGPKIIETSTFRANPREVEAEVPLEGAIPDGLGGLDAGEPTAFLASPTDAARVAEEILIRRDNVFGSAEEDARRRDFTINGLFYDLDADKVIDYVDGLPDLEKRTVRTIGEPDIRFREDPVRILRAIKFAARLDFNIEAESYRAILEHRGEIAKCAPPRVLEEIYRLFRGGAGRRSLELLVETSVLEMLIPELARRLAQPTAAAGQLFALLDSVDDLVREGVPTSNALILCVLVAPYVADVLYDPEENFRGGPPLFQLLDERMQPMLDSVRASRRDVERTKQILLAQRRLLPSKRRRGKPMALVRRDWFDEALLLFEMMHPEPSDEIVEEVQHWRRLAENASSDTNFHSGVESATPSPSGQNAGQVVDPNRRKRRRRGGRRRHKMLPSDASS